jgi:hypothetical protein
VLPGEVAGEAQLAEVQRGVADALDERFAAGDLPRLAGSPQLLRRVRRSSAERGRLRNAASTSSPSCRRLASRSVASAPQALNSAGRSRSTGCPQPNPSA